jgi:hypothetical protein
MTKKKVWPLQSRPTFIECGQCGHWHSQDLPGSVDCRDDAHRFSTTDLENRYGEALADVTLLDLDDQAAAAGL